MFEYISAKGVDPEEYISFFGLRKHDFLNDSAITEQVCCSSFHSPAEPCREFDAFVSPSS